MSAVLEHGNDLLITWRGTGGSLIGQLQFHLVHKERTEDGAISLVAVSPKGDSVTVTVRAELLQEVPAAAYDPLEGPRRAAAATDSVLRRLPL
jgi:hypothetical protein